MAHDPSKSGGFTFVETASFCRGSGRGPCPRRDRGGLRRSRLVPGHQLGGLGPAANYDYQNFTYSQGLTGDGHWEGVRALDYVTLPDPLSAEKPA